MTMFSKGCIAIRRSMNQTLLKWPFDNLENQNQNIILCGKIMNQTFMNYTCDKTHTKQCGKQLCVSPNEPCPLKEILFTQGGNGKKINDKWTLIEIEMTGNTDSSYPFQKFQVEECKQCFPQQIRKNDFFTANGIMYSDKNSFVNLQSIYFTRLEPDCPLLNLNDDLWEVQKIQLFACVSCGVFAGFFGGLILLITTCSLIGCDIGCLVLGEQNPIYAEIIKFWIFVKYVGELVALIAIICSFITQTNFLSSIQWFIHNSCTEQVKLDELEEFIRYYKKYIYYFTLVDIILYMGTFTADVIFGQLIWTSHNFKTTTINKYVIRNDYQQSPKVEFEYQIQYSEESGRKEEKVKMIDRSVQCSHCDQLKISKMLFFFYLKDHSRNNQQVPIDAELIESRQ